LSVNNNEGNEDPHEYEPLVKYIDVLIESFPKPITRKDLAKKTDVSTAAITKVGDRLLKLCDRNVLVFDRRLILLKDETYWKLFSVYFFRQRLPQFILSNYGLEIIRLFDIHGKISAQVKEYPEYFTEKDTETMIRLFLHNVKNLKVLNEFKANMVDPQLRVMLLSMNYATALGNLLQRFDLPIETSEDLTNILTIRDKVFHFSKHMIIKRLKEASIMSTLSETEKENYLEVYTGTVDFYLKRLLNIFTDLIAKVAKRKNLEFKEEYKTIDNYGCWRKGAVDKFESAA
jgi:hypothetical protein